MEKRKNIAVGIDLGTTYSAVALVNDYGMPEIIPNAEGERLTPSAVFFDDESVVVGQIAKDNAVSDPDKAVMFVKRLMGNPNWFYEHNSQKLTPPDISALILAKIKKDAESELGESIKYALITVPAYFDDDRRRATITAGELAGFKVLGLINEPSAAAIAYGYDRKIEEETILVYDLGGGTFDVTILKVNSQDFEILATDGAHQLGGKDFEDCIIGYCVDKFKTEHGFDPTTDLYDYQEIRKDAEKVKRELSTRNKSLMSIRSWGKNSRIEIDRNTFEELIRPKLDSSLYLIKDVLKQAKLEASDIDRVVLIGGSTRIPAVRTMLTEFFGKDVDISINPDEAVAMGAALMASKKVLDLDPEELPAQVIEKIGGLQVTDVTSHSLGIEAFVPGSNQKLNSILIHRNSPIPSEVSKEFVTTIAGQTAIKITLYQGEFTDPDLCNPIGDFVLSGLPSNRPAGCKVRVSITCGENGIVGVTAVDIETGIEMQKQVTYKVGETTEKVSAKKKWMNSQRIE